MRALFFFFCSVDTCRSCGTKFVHSVGAHADRLSVCTCKEILAEAERGGRAFRLMSLPSLILCVRAGQEAGGLQL